MSQLRPAELELEAREHSDTETTRVTAKDCYSSPPKTLPLGGRPAMKYILVSGGVVSGLGKGVTASSVGVLLKNCGFRVTSIKIGAFKNSHQLSCIVTSCAGCADTARG